MSLKFTKEELKQRRVARRHIVKKRSLYYIKSNTTTGLSDLCSKDPEWCYWILGAPHKFKS